MSTFMNKLERWIVYPRHRWYLQRFYEIPVLRTIGFRDEMIRGKKVLEVGCGTGHAAHRLLTKYGAESVTAVDLDAEAVAIANRNYPSSDRLNFHVADATKLPYAGETFDVVIGFGLLHHIPIWQTAVQEVSRVLKHGGKYVLDDFTAGGLKKGYHSVFDHPRHNRFTTGQLLATLKNNFFQVDDMTHRLGGDVIFAISSKL